MTINYDDVSVCVCVFTIELDIGHDWAFRDLCLDTLIAMWVESV